MMNETSNKTIFFKKSQLNLLFKNIMDVQVDTQITIESPR